MVVRTRSVAGGRVAGWCGAGVAVDEGQGMVPGWMGGEATGRAVTARAAAGAAAQSLFRRAIIGA